VDPDRLSDLYAIGQLKARYFRYLDTKAWDLWRLLFTDDVDVYIEASAEPGQPVSVSSGADSFVARVSSILETAVTVHHGHMPEIEFTGPDEATGVWAMYDWVDNADREYAVQGWGHYHERYRRGTDGVWRISELRLTRLRTDFIEPTSPGDDRHWPPPWRP
jgi:SnoaL-like domain